MNEIKDPLISVIIPFLNGGEWLPEAIEGVLHQTYTNWEIILVDDGSKEEVTSIAKKYAERLPDKIIYTEHPGHVNKGLTASRNLGVKTSKGNIVALLDADDFWLPQKLKNQVLLFHLHPNAGMLCEASKYWYSWENPSRHDIVIQVGNVQDKLYDPLQLMFELYPLGKGAAPCPSALMIRKEVIERAGGFEESFTGPYQAYEDQAFLAKVYLREHVYISGEANNLYRQRSGSLMQHIHNKQGYLKVRGYFLNWLQRYLQDKEVANGPLNRTIQQALFEVNYPALSKVKRKLNKIFNLLN